MFDWIRRFAQCAGHIASAVAAVALTIAAAAATVVEVVGGLA